uniref:EF-hand domain-containing protein n=1 Tax=Kalanchoe fedtschenkoi TaxID=63787 RepID=A0A7N1A7H6_KALFE
MEELHKVARAYYENGSPEVRSLTQKFFESMDTNRDGTINRQEFMAFLNREGCTDARMNHYLFAEMDRDNNGIIDFNEFLTLYYIIKTKNGYCCQCWRCLKGLYFTCATCFDCPTARTFDLCTDCYMTHRGAQHPHANFVDSALLLRARRNVSSFHYPVQSTYAVQHLMQPTSSHAIHPQYQPGSKWVSVM